MARVAARLLMLASVLSVGLLLAAGFIVVVLLIVVRLFFPDGIGPDDDFIGGLYR